MQRVPPTETLDSLSNKQNLKTLIDVRPQVLLIPVQSQSLNTYGTAQAQASMEVAEHVSCRILPTKICVQMPQRICKASAGVPHTSQHKSFKSFSKHMDTQAPPLYEILMSTEDIREAEVHSLIENWFLPFYMLVCNLATSHASMLSIRSIAIQFAHPMLCRHRTRCSGR